MRCRWFCFCLASLKSILVLTSLFLQLAVESLPDAPVTEVRPEEKMKAPADTEAAPEDIDEVIELPDVPTKAPERPEASEKNKGFDLVLLFHPIILLGTFVLFISCIDDIHFADSFGGATTCIAEGTEMNRAHLVCRNCNIPTISLYYLIFSHIRILLCTARKFVVLDYQLSPVWISQCPIY